jgi:hypothetical protein
MIFETTTNESQSESNMTNVQEQNQGDDVGSNDISMDLIDVENEKSRKRKSFGFNEDE